MEIFGQETIQRAGLLWGLDEEGELRNVYRPTGHPAVSVLVLPRYKHETHFGLALVLWWWFPEC